VEAVRGPARLLDERERLEDRALGRGAPERELELDRLACVHAAEAADAPARALVVAAAANRRGDDHDGAARPADLGAERAAVERVEAGAPPPPPDGGEAGGGEDEPHGRGGARGRAGRERKPEAEAGRADPPEVGRGKPGAERRGEEVRRDGPAEAHGTTSPRRFSIRAGPIPGIASSSSTERKGPCAWR